MADLIWEHALSNSKNTLRVIESLVDGMAKSPGQRMILLTSAGFLAGNLEADGKPVDGQGTARGSSDQHPGRQAAVHGVAGRRLFQVEAGDS